ncbi:DNA helicase [Pseudomonas phage PspYZU05]|uniref:Helicase n=1 Tax=Pseudomonas phage PspYZU05 TaxID=1983556 RepID=A0A2U7NN28_9CAUD|nr:DNA helicase [Pseudomonas phage PspYZU05]ASD52097.1 helicase [Pseudomonas phage PspYZU05]
MVDIEVVFQNHSHVYVKCEQSTFYEIKDHFSFFADGYQFNPKYRYGGWSGKIYLLENSALLPFGLVSHLKKFADSMGYNIWIDPRITEIDPLTREDFDKWVNSLEIYSGQNRIKPHWYQADAVYEGLVNKRRILNLPTSAGKSLIQCLLSRYYVENFEGKVLIIVPTTALVDQMIDDFVDYRLFPRSAMLGIRSGTARDSDALIYVSTWQTAIKQSKEWLSQFGMLMNDECHLSTGKSIQKIVSDTENCQYKFGLSGSLKDGKANLMQYVGLFGAIFKPVSTSQLMEDGQVTDLKINTIFLRYPDEIAAKVKSHSYQEEIKYITSSARRNKWVCSLAAKLAAKNENTFVMFKNIAHGKALFNELKKSTDKVYYVSGEVSTEERNLLKKLTEQDNGVVVIASYGVFSTGISVKKLHNVILAHPVKSKIIVLQTIGRVLRKHESKDIATVWDIVDDLGVKPKSANAKKKYTHMNYALKHALERIQRYAEEKFNYVVKSVQI